MFNSLKQAAAEAAKKAAEAGRQAADEAGRFAQGPARDAAGQAMTKLQDPATQARAKLVAKSAGDRAGKIVSSALDKLNPATLAAIVIKATSVQEQANAALRNSKSLYRIGGIEIGAAFPPSISFQIVRAAELEIDEEAMGNLDAGRVASQLLEAQGPISEPDPDADEDDRDEGDSDNDPGDRADDLGGGAPEA